MAISNKTLKMLKYIGIGFTAGVANGLFGSGGDQAEVQLPYLLWCFY